MFNSKVLISFAILFLCASSLALADVRMEAVEHALDAYAQEQSDPCWGDVCAIDKVPVEVETEPVIVGQADPVYEVTMDEIVVTPETVSAEGHMRDSVSLDDVNRVGRARSSFYYEFLDLKNPRNDLEVGMEWFDYTYREEGLMKLDGSMTGVYGIYTHRKKVKVKPVTNWKEFWNFPERVNMFRLDARYSQGTDIHYRSEGTGENFDEKHYYYEMRGVFGYDVPMKRDILITPYAGLGYRYLKDDNGGEQTTTGHWGYDRESRYVYAPLGLDISRRLDDLWTVGLNLEYDYFLDGRQTSHLEDVPGYTRELVNDQNDGYGLRGSVKVVRAAHPCNIVMEPFVRYWHIDNSEASNNGEYSGLEPNNRTWEIGAKLGIQF